MTTRHLGKFKANLGIGPMSTEAIEATFRYSHFHRKELMLISSKNQIDHNGGYVNHWTTSQYAHFIGELRDLYPDSKVKVCRDHCGPGFNGIYDLDDSYETIKADIKNGFDLIHIDFCHFKGTKKKQIEETRKAIDYVLKLNPNTAIEIGTDENVGANYNLPNLSEIEREIDFFKSFCKPEFYVVQTGSLIKEINQTGSYNGKFVKRIAQLLHSKDVKLKEHNADYLDKESILQRRGVVDAMNIAPQLGSMQTTLILNRCLTYGISFIDFVNEAYKSKKWQKWLDKNTSDNRMLCSIISGHYVFDSDSYKTVVKRLSKSEDIKETIINNFMDLIDHYEQ